MAGSARWRGTGGLPGIVEIAQDQPHGAVGIGEAARDQAAGGLGFEGADAKGGVRVGIGRFEMHGEEREAGQFDAQAVPAEDGQVGGGAFGRVQAKIGRAQRGIADHLERRAARQQRKVITASVIAGQAAAMPIGGQAKGQEQLVVEMIERGLVEHFLQDHEIGVEIADDLCAQRPVAARERGAAGFGRVAVARAAQAPVAQAQALQVETGDAHRRPFQMAELWPALLSA